MKKEQILLSIGFLLFMIGGGGIQSDGIYMLVFAGIALAGLGLMLLSTRAADQTV